MLSIIAPYFVLFVAIYDIDDTPKVSNYVVISLVKMMSNDTL